MILMSERIVSLTFVAFSKSVGWEAGSPKVLGGLLRDFFKEGQRCL